MPADSSAAAIVALDPAWRPAATESLRLAAAGDGVLYLLTSPSGGGGSSSGSAPSLRRLTLATGEEEVLELSRVSATPAGMFADPHSSTSVLIAHANGDTVYVHRSRSRVLGKARGLLITAVAWLRPDPSRSDTREVLLGSSSGAIFEAALEPTRTSRYRQLFTLSPPAPLCGLAAEPFASQGAPDDKRLLVLAATPTRYYEFVGPASLEALFASYRELSHLGHVEVEGPPPGTAWPPPHKGSSLDFDRRRGQEGGGRGSGASPPSAFAWLSARGVYCGSLLFGAQAPRDSCVYDSVPARRTRPPAPRLWQAGSCQRAGGVASRRSGHTRRPPTWRRALVPAPPRRPRCAGRRSPSPSQICTCSSCTVAA
mmetsp:Transcript_16843/g.56709  ORF Transcript_16843/g.56709 Transcript_16843/m.56709 type:complete len:370 (-) Transcript_16843:835-1944(-)